MKKEIIEWLKAQDCIFETDGTVRTKNGDYVTLATLNNCPIANLIYNHKLTDLQSIDFAKNGIAGNAVGIGFNKEEQKWYGFTHRGYGSFGIGYKPDDDCWIIASGYVPKGYEAKTLEDCKKCACYMSDFLD